MPVRELKQKPLSPAVQKYRETFGHLPAMESLKFLTPEELESKALQALKMGQPVKSWAERSKVKMGTNLDGFYQKD